MIYLLLQLRNGVVFFLRGIRDIFMVIMNILSPALSQLGLIFLPIAIVFEVTFGKRFRRPTRTDSPDLFPYTELAEGFSDSGATVLLISGAKPLDTAVFVYADFYPHLGKKTFLPQTRLFTALNRDESYEIRIPWQLYHGTKLWSVSRLDILIGNDSLFGGTGRTSDVMRLAAKCFEILFEPTYGAAAHTQTVNALGRVLLSCRELEKEGRPFFICTYQGKEKSIIRLARSETEKNAQIGLDITIQGHPNLEITSKYPS